MKKAWLVPILITLVLCGFTCGFLVGRNDNSNAVRRNIRFFIEISSKNDDLSVLIGIHNNV